jgi:hypothetical protein
MFILLSISCKKKKAEIVNSKIITSSYFLLQHCKWQYKATWKPNGADTAKFILNYSAVGDTFLNVDDVTENLKGLFKGQKITCYLKQYGPVDKGIDSSFDTASINVFYNFQKRKLYQLVGNSCQVLIDFEGLKTGSTLQLKSDTVIGIESVDAGAFVYPGFVLNTGYVLTEGISLFDPSNGHFNNWSLPWPNYTEIAFSSSEFQYTWKRKP